jgi:hypothetical protein
MNEGKQKNKNISLIMGPDSLSQHLTLNLLKTENDVLMYYPAFIIFYMLGFDLSMIFLGFLTII